jgi:hypothetical protein
MLNDMIPVVITKSGRRRKVPAPVGVCVVSRRGQIFRCVGEEAYTTRMGEDWALWTWISDCRECGEMFTIGMPAEAPINPTNFNKRCREHRKPGVTAR